MIKINLYDHQKIVVEAEVTQRVASAFYTTMAGLAGIGMIWFFTYTNVNSVKQEADEMDQAVATLKPRFDKVEKMKADQKAIEGKISHIDKLRHSEYEAPQLMEDLSESIPEGLWLIAVEQKGLDKLRQQNVPVLFLDEEDKKKKKGKDEKGDGAQHLFIELRGTAKSDQAIVRYIEQLEGISYLDNVFLHMVNRGVIGFEKVRNFTIYCHVTNPDLLSPKV